MRYKLFCCTLSRVNTGFKQGKAFVKHSGRQFKEKSVAFKQTLQSFLLPACHCSWKATRSKRAWNYQSLVSAVTRCERQGDRKLTEVMRQVKHLSMESTGLNLFQTNGGRLMECVPRSFSIEFQLWLSQDCQHLTAACFQNVVFVRISFLYLFYLSVCFYSNVIVIVIKTRYVWYLPLVTSILKLNLVIQVSLPITCNLPVIYLFVIT